MEPKDEKNPDDLLAVLRSMAAPGLAIEASHLLKIAVKRSALGPRISFTLAWDAMDALDQDTQARLKILMAFKPD